MRTSPIWAKTRAYSWSLRVRCGTAHRLKQASNHNDRQEARKEGHDQEGRHEEDDEVSACFGRVGLIFLSASFDATLSNALASVFLCVCVCVCVLSFCVFLLSFFLGLMPFRRESFDLLLACSFDLSFLSCICTPEDFRALAFYPFITRLCVHGSTLLLPRIYFARIAPFFVHSSA